MKGQKGDIRGGRERERGKLGERGKEKERERESQSVSLMNDANAS